MACPEYQVQALRESRWDVVEAHTRATATVAVGFLDGGSEFQSAGVYPERSRREQACQQRGIRLFVLPPRSPKLNRCVERTQRTHTEECYEVVESSREVAALNRELLAWEQTYNTIRPHQALGYLPPTSSSPSGNPNERRQRVTDLLDEYISLRRYPLVVTIARQGTQAANRPRVPSVEGAH